MRYIQIRKIEQHFGRKTAAKRSSRLRFAQTAAYKMSRSVSRVLLSYGHLSRRTVAGTLQPPRERPGKPNAPISVLLRIEFTAPHCLQPASELLPHFSTLTRSLGRFVSVALVRGSPLAGVTRYPCPVEPGLSSRTAFRLVPAAVRPARPTILHILPHRVKSGSDLFSCNRHE